METQRFSWNFVLQGFWDRWLRIWHRMFNFQNGGSNMAAMKFWKLYDFRTTLYSGVFGVTDCEFQIEFTEFRRLWVDFDEIFCVFPVSPNIFSCSSETLSNRYCKFFCSNFILAISGRIVYYESIHNSLITSLFRSASEPELSEPGYFRFGAVVPLLFHQNYFRCIHFILHVGRYRRPFLFLRYGEENDNY